MKLLTFIALFFTTQPLLASSAYCELFHSGVSDKFSFDQYLEESIDDFDDPACLTPMGRACSQIKVGRSLMTLPRGIFVEHETRETTWGGKMKKSSFRIFLMKGKVLVEVGGALKKLKSSELRVTVGKILQGGYSLECKD